jgi:histidine kinase/DNA gyrase B/HSP90-like ATPase
MTSPTDGPPAEQPRLDTVSDFEKALRKPGDYEALVETDQRIICGLYREPASAIRELISNAYDADAENVEITTDAPHFRKVTVKDDGIGMSVGAVKQLLRNVGGSLKQAPAGSDAGITGKIPGESNAGRRLIGKMGIGFYSVARLTSHFKITTKQKGDDFEVVIEVNLTGFDFDADTATVDDAEADAAGGEGGGDSASSAAANGEATTDGAEEPPTIDYVAGIAKITARKVKASERGRQGTLVELLDINVSARRVLQSIERWENRDIAAKNRAGLLKYHIERMDPEKNVEIAPAVPPWTAKTPKDKRFEFLINRLSAPGETSAANPSIDQTLDYYLGMLWKISLSAPLDYIKTPPFELTPEDGIEFYSLAGDATPEALKVPKGMSIGEHLGVRIEKASPIPFSVKVDDVPLKRPVRFETFVPDNRKLLKKPKMFVGEWKSEDQRRRNLTFTAYFFWSYDIVPKENNGILVRINGSSGTGFDKQFLDFRTSELQRLRQVSSEVFVSEGLADALNIDRESFDDANQHYQDLQRWVHRQMTRLMSRLKADQKKATAGKKDTKQRLLAETIDEFASSLWKTRKKSRRAHAPSVIVTSRSEDDIEEDADIVVTGVRAGKRGTVDRDVAFNAQLRGIVLVLDAHGLLEDLNEFSRSSVINDIAKVLKQDA